MAQRSPRRDLDLVLLGAVLVLMSFGTVMIYSATHGSLSGAGGDSFRYARTQVIAALIGIAIGAVVVAVDYHELPRYAPLAYVGALGLLVLAVVAGEEAWGAERWLSIGPLRLQPSEIAKLSVILSLATQLDRKERLREGWDLVSPILHIAPPMALIILQPDLGTALVFVGILLGMLYVGGARLRHLAVLVGTGALVAGVAIFLSLQGWLPLLKEYQVQRLITFLDPYAYRDTSGWNVIQSMIAVGSGGFFGKGLLAGTQTQLSFLPARHTDFIFSVVGEELGFLGASVTLAAYLVVLWRGLRIVGQARDRLGALLAMGVVSMLGFHVVINVGMTLGVMPITGLPLPFLSAGGSNLVASLIGVAILLNINLRRRKLSF